MAAIPRDQSDMESLPPCAVHGRRDRLARQAHEIHEPARLRSDAQALASSVLGGSPEAAASPVRRFRPPSPSAGEEPDADSARGESVAGDYAHRRRQELALHPSGFVGGRRDYRRDRAPNLAAAGPSTAISEAQCLLPRVAGLALGPGQPQDPSCHSEDLCAPGVPRRAKLTPYDGPAGSHRLRPMLSAAGSRLELPYNLPAAVGARSGGNATALPDNHHAAVAGVRFLASAAPRVDHAGAGDTSYDHYACQHSLRGSEPASKRERHTRGAATCRERLTLRQDSCLLYDPRSGRELGARAGQPALPREAGRQEQDAAAICYIKRQGLASTLPECRERQTLPHNDAWRWLSFCLEHRTSLTEQVAVALFHFLLTFGLSGIIQDIVWSMLC